MSMLVSKMRSLLRWPGKVRYVAWSTLRRKMVYGYTESQVRSRLTRISLFGVGVAVHRKAAPVFIKWNTQVRAYERAHGLKPWYARDIQCFNWRVIRGGTSLSRHAHAIAVDIDPARNVYNGEVTTIPSYVIQIGVDCGLDWGGRWHDPVDPMHFQLH